MRIYSNTIRLLPITQPFRWADRAVKIWLSRRAMAGLDRAMLSDLGMSASAAAFEASRPFWDMPRDER
jgi:uncharacterized protein YjiS (DUF1127 family)